MTRLWWLDGLGHVWAPAAAHCARCRYSVDTDLFHREGHSYDDDDFYCAERWEQTDQQDQNGATDGEARACLAVADAAASPVAQISGERSRSHLDLPSRYYFIVAYY
ncbi:MAG: hypothetical protein ACYDHB_00685 [Candidatus Dormibacteria bacterium]